MFPEQKHLSDLTIIPKIWGYEHILVNTPRYCSKILSVTPGFQCSIHYHKDKGETFLVQEGLLRLELWTWKKVVVSCPIESPRERDFLGEKTTLILRPGDSITLPPNTPHRFSSDSCYEPCVFYEFSSHDDPEDSYRLESSGPKVE